MHSFIDVHPDSHFPIQNLPYGVFSSREGGRPRVGVAIGDHMLDLSVLDAGGYFDGIEAGGRKIFSKPALNDFMSLGRQSWVETRNAVQELLQADNPTLRDDAQVRQRAFLPVNDVQMHLPAEIGDPKIKPIRLRHRLLLGKIHRRKGDLRKARELLESQLSEVRLYGDPSITFAWLRELSLAALFLGDFEKARPLMEECLKLAREMGDPQELMVVLTDLGHLGWQTNHVEESLPYVQECLIVAQAL